MESQKLVPVNCSDSQGGGISQMGQFQLSGEISHPGPSFSLIQNIQKYVLCLPEKMTVNPCPKDNNNNNNLDFSPLMCTEHLSLCRLISLKVFVIFIFAFCCIYLGPEAGIFSIPCYWGWSWAALEEGEGKQDNSLACRDDNCYC